ncbi:MAG TPA: hypothetical protein VMV81_06430 [Phycisphaerae bacterium]|nr:hypothetical protein [Phycisphaerae bacterium]
MRSRIIYIGAGCILAIGPSSAQGAAFSSADNLAVMRCSDGFGAEKIFIDEFNVSAASPVLVQTIALPTSGTDAVTMPGLTNHDRHLHLSSDGRTLVLAGYHWSYDPDPSADPSGMGAADAPRMIVLVKSDGTLDLTTRLTTTCDYTSIRGAATSDGVNIWIAGDNASGATTSGGTRYTTLGSSTSVNLSQVQVIQPSPMPDNVRNINVFGGQLYNSSGSNATIGKAFFKVGNGLPTSGSQTLTRLNAADSSISSFYFLDASSTVSGVDTAYAASSNPQSLQKYNKVGSSWTLAGSIATVNDVEHVVARLGTDGSATIYFITGGNVYRIVDPTPYGGTLSGSLPQSYITPATAAGAGYTLGGLDFTPGCASSGDMNGDGVLNLSDVAPFTQALVDPIGFQASHPTVPLSRGDMNCDGALNGIDVRGFVSALLNH